MLGINTKKSMQMNLVGPCAPTPRVNVLASWEWHRNFHHAPKGLHERDFCFNFQIQMNVSQVMVSALTRVLILRAPIVVNVARDFTWIQMEDLAQVRWC